MATLLDIANASESTLKRGFIRNIVDTSAALSFLNFEMAPSLRYEFSVEGNLPSPAFRALNSAYSPTEGDFTRNTLHLKPFGNSFLLDRKLKRIPTFDGSQWAAKQLEMTSRAISLDFKKNLFKGDVGVDPAAFNGLERIVEDELAATQSIIYNGGPDGDTLDVAVEIVNNINRSIDACESVPNVIYCNRTHLQDIHATIMGGAPNDILAVHFKYTTMVINGITKRVGIWADTIPMIPVDRDSDNAEILAFDETQGASAGTTSSMYFVVNGASQFTAVQDMTPEITVREDSAGTEWIVDWAIGVVAEHPRSIVRLKGIIALP